MPGGRTFGASRFVLELDGNPVGFLRSAEGGAISAEVVSVHGQSYFDEKHIGQVRYEDFALELDLSLDASVYDWIAKTFIGKPQRRDGSIIAVDTQFKARSELQFFQALLTEVAVPVMDAGSKDAAFLTVKFAPEYTRMKKGSGASIKISTAKQKAWHVSNFKLEIDGLDCTKVSKIEAFTVKQAVVRDDIGDVRQVVREPSRLDFPNLRISVAESAAQTWSDWFDDFVVKGNDDSTKERQGKLTFLAPDLKQALGEVALFGLGIFRLEREPQVAGIETVSRLRADLYCERMELGVSLKS
jgi:hypothetical protein